MKDHIIFLAMFMMCIACQEATIQANFPKQESAIFKQNIIDINYDTISAGCGYFNLLQSRGKIKPYFQVFIEDFNEIQAVGLLYNIDTICIKNPSADNNLLNIDSIQAQKLDFEAINQEFGLYGYAIDYRNYDTVQIINFHKTDSITLVLKSQFIDSNLIIRYLEYFEYLKK